MGGPVWCGTYAALRRFGVESVARVVQRRGAKLIDGKAIAEDVKNSLRLEIDEWTKLGNRPPRLWAVQVGDDQASATYVRNKMEAARQVGIISDTLQLPATINEHELLAKIGELNADDSVDGVLVQLPVPAHIDERNVCNAVDVDKDVDGFHILNFGRLCLNMETFVPATALGVIELIKRTGIETKGKKAVVCGRSKNVGLAITMLLHSDAKYPLPGLEATTVMCHRNTKPEDLEAYCKSADIIVSATGIVGLIKPHMVKPEACIIDVGLTRITDENGKTKLVGDVDFEGVRHVAGYITPVPGGVGPMTVAMLMKNTVQAAKNLAKKRTG